MDIIAAHRQGLIEKLEEEAASLAGRPRDFGQRAVVYHHLYDHSRGTHEWALAEARSELRIARAVESLRRWLSLWGWLVKRREQALRALDDFAEALGTRSQARCASAYAAYRLSGMKSLQSEAEVRLSPELLEVLKLCHLSRRSGDPITNEIRWTLFNLTESSVCASVADDGWSAAWAAIEATGLKRAARRRFGSKARQRLLTHDRKLGWHNVERQLRNDPALPAGFRANPAQHFYALQNVLAGRRLQQWREACDLELDSIELAA